MPTQPIQVRFTYRLPDVAQACSGQTPAIRYIAVLDEDPSEGGTFGLPHALLLPEVRRFA